MRLDMAKLAFQPLTLRCKVTVGDAWVLESGENEHALIIAERDDARWPMSKRLLMREALDRDAWSLIVSELSGQEPEAGAKNTKVRNKSKPYQWRKSTSCAAEQHEVV